MSWLNNYVYEEAKPVFDCTEGVNAMCIKSVEEGTSKNGERMLVVSCNVKNSNGEQYKLFLVEGQYFDKNISRLLDCFGILNSEAENTNNWVNKIGNALFDHYKYNSQTKKNEIVPEIQCHLKKKEGFVQQVITRPAPTNTTLDNGIPEDIPF